VIEEGDGIVNHDMSLSFLPSELWFQLISTVLQAAGLLFVNERVSS
jgi:hypothetical protein